MALAMVRIYQNCGEKLKGEINSAVESKDGNEITEFFQKFFRKGIEAKIYGEVKISVDIDIPNNSVRSATVEQEIKNFYHYSVTSYD
jgi:hypothetical protein